METYCHDRVGENQTTHAYIHPWSLCLLWVDLVLISLHGAVIFCIIHDGRNFLEKGNTQRANDT